MASAELASSLENAASVILPMKSRYPREEVWMSDLGKLYGYFTSFVFIYFLCTYNAITQIVDRGQQTTCRSQFSSSTIWIPTIRLTSSDLVESVFTFSPFCCPLFLLYRKQNAKAIREGLSHPTL